MCKTAAPILLFIGILFSAASVYGQQLRIVAETDQFTEYLFSNDSLEIAHAHEFLIGANQAQTYSVVNQKVVSKTFDQDSKSLIEAFAIQSSSTPLLDSVNKGVLRGQEVANLRFHPTRFRESSPNEFLIVQEARFRVYHRQDSKNRITVNRLLSNESSPFQSGQWFKIPIDDKGIYQLDAEYFEELGLSTSGIDPRNIQIWATPGGELPRLNSAEKPTLAEIPIIVQGEDNGEFNQNDRVIFYADSPHQEFRDISANQFSHQLNRYSDYNYVFITVGNQNGKRLNEESFQSPSTTITRFRDFVWHEKEEMKSEPRIRSGLEWYFLRFSTSTGNRNQVILNRDIPGLIPNQTIDIDIQFVGRSTHSMEMEFFLNGNSIGAQFSPSINSYSSEEGISGRLRNFRTTAALGNNNEVNLSAQLNASEPNSEAFIDWVRVSFDRELVTENSSLFIYAPEDVSGQVAEYQLRGFSSAPLVFEVSNPQQPRLLDVNSSGNDHTFRFSHTQDNRFMAQSTFIRPEQGSVVENQNVRGLNNYPEYIIIAGEIFTDQAEEWAQYRQETDGFSTVMVTQEQLFNEFSGGTPDVTAIRDYLKFLYDRALASGNELPKHVLLFGDATYDFKNIMNGSVTNHVFTFQSDESLSRINTYGSDDYFGLLDDDEGEWATFTSSERLDIGIGRFPVNTRGQAEVVMNKIRDYEDPANREDWRTKFTFSADDDFPDVERNRDLHTLNADGTAVEIDKNGTATRVDKVYMLSYPTETSAAGRRVPGATNDFIQAFNSGSLVINYSGHGAEFVLSDQRLFNTDLIPRLNNRDRLSIFVTATCQFGRYDDNNTTSGAEQTLLWENGGTVAAFTTTRVVFTSATPGSNNFGLNIQLTRQMIQRDQNGRPQRLGNIYMNTKNTTQGSGFNARKFILLGDPAMRIGLPENKMQVTSINNIDFEQYPDTVLQLQALDKVQFEGVVTDPNGNRLLGYNGESSIRVFDAERTVNLPNRNWVEEGRCFMQDCRYKVENDILFNGLVSIQDGQFSSEFIVPRDISFSDDRGRILVYSTTEGTDGAGSRNNLFFNGINENAPQDIQGPTMDVYLNDENFVNGNLVGSSSTLIVELEDQSGINTTGTGVGHEITATIDTTPTKTVVLNEFYRSELNNYQKGRIEYPLEDLPPGNYSLNVRAWDVYNNPAEKSIQFEVADSEELQIRNVYNYPNPMNNRTRFVFEHNQPGNLMDIDIRIFTLSGMPVTHLRESQITTNSYANIEWNGFDRDNDRLANGTYIYVLRVRTDTPQGTQTKEKIEKLVIIR